MLLETTPDVTYRNYPHATEKGYSPKNKERLSREQQWNYMRSVIGPDVYLGRIFKKGFG